MIDKAKISRRTLLQMGLGAGTGLALWNLYRVAVGSRANRGAPSIEKFGDAAIDDSELSRLLGLALERGGERSEVFVEYSVSSYMSFDEDRLEYSGIEVDRGAAVRVVSNGNRAFRVTEDLTSEGLCRAAREASMMAQAGTPAIVAAPRTLRAASLYQVDSPAILQPMDGKRNLVLRMVEAAKRADPEVHTVRASYRDTLRFITIATSDGAIARDTQPLLKVGLSVVAISEKSGRHGVGSFYGGGRYGLEYFEEHSPEEIGQRAAGLARHQLEGLEAPAGDLPVVLGPAYSGVLIHEAVGHGLEADFNLKGYSTYSNRIGQMVASPQCTIVDDGAILGLNGSSNFDDEAVPTSRSVLIERGRLAGYLHSRDTAARMGVTPTGNGRCQGFGFPPVPRMTNTYLQAGEVDPEEIIRSVGFGIYAKTFSGGSTNTATGDFNFIPTEAYLIESGRVTAPLSNVILLGNGPEILKRVSMVGSDLRISDNLSECGKQGQIVPVTIGTPTIKIDALTVGGTWGR
jgi:TldD protein